MATIELGAERVRRRIVRPRFYLVMSLLMAAVFIAGFSQTVPGDFAPKPGLPLLLHAHGAVFTLWVLLFVAQPAIVARGSLAFHRKLGWVGAALALLMVAMGWTATWLSIREHRVPPFFPPGIFLVMNGLGMVVFAGLIGAGVALRRRAEWHKRLMLLATVSILGPGLGRMLPPTIGPAGPLIINGVILAFALAGPVADLVTRRRVHAAYGWGVAAILLGMAAVPALGFSPAILALVKAISG